MSFKMKERPTTGIRIFRHNMELVTEKKKEKNRVIDAVRALLLAGCIIGVIMTFVDTLGLSIHVEKAAAMVLAGCFVLYMGRISRKGKMVTSAYFCCLVAAAFLMGKRLVEDAAFVVLMAVTQVERYLGVGAGTMETGVTGSNGELFLIWFFMLLTVLLFYGVVHQTRIKLLFFLTGAAFFLQTLMGSKLEGMGIYISASCLFVLVALKKEKEYSRKTALFQAGMEMGLLVLVLALISGAFLGPALYQRMDRANQKVYETVQQVLEKGQEFLNGKGLGWSGWSSFIKTMDGSLKNKLENDKDQIDLRVTLSEKPVGNVYLRGFTADTYEGSYWHKIDNSEFQEAFPEEGSGKQVQNILCRYIEGKGAPMNQQAAVERVHASKNYGYLPYGFMIPDQVDGDGVYENRGDKIEYSGCVNWNEWVGHGAAREEGSDWEKRYWKYVTSQYLKIPVEGIERLTEYCDAHTGESVQQVIDFVVSDIKEGRVYETDLEPVPPGEDFAEYFFFQQKKGFCIHYATTATLMLRNMGVPARYVTGYVAFPQDFVETEEGYTAEVFNKQAHAWVEVYRSGKGWIPLETTPGYQAISHGTGQTEQSEPVEEEQTQMPEPVEETIPTPEGVPQQQGDIEAALEDGSIQEGKTQENEQEYSGAVKIIKEAGKILGKLLVIAGVLIFLAGGVEIQRRMRIRGRRKRYYQENHGKGICEISYDLSQMLEDGGVRIAGENDLAYAEMADKTIKVLEEGEYETFVRLVQKASYGKERMTSQERDQCILLYEKINSFLFQNFSTVKKLWWKYMKAYDLT